MYEKFITFVATPATTTTTTQIQAQGPGPRSLRAKLQSKLASSLFCEKFSKAKKKKVKTRGVSKFDFMGVPVTFKKLLLEGSILPLLCS